MSEALPELKPCPFCGYALTTCEGICEGYVDGSEEEEVEFTGICCPGCAVFLQKPEENSTALDGVNAWNRRPSPVNGRWRVFESVFDRTHFGIELEAASNDDDPILYSMKIKRETVQAIVDAHNASLATS